MKVNRKAKTIMQLAVIEVRLLKEKIRVLENCHERRQELTFRLQTMEHFRSYTPILKVQARAKLPFQSLPVKPH